MPLVLVQNERTIDGNYDHWKDVTGEQYHFPNVYKNKIEAGEPFIYYRGVRTAGGKRRKSPEYFGTGIIGETWRDAEIPIDAPKSAWHWFCRIYEFTPFAQPIEWRDSSGKQFEDIPRPLYQTGCRTISQDTFDRILTSAGLGPSESNGCLYSSQILR